MPDGSGILLEVNSNHGSILYDSIFERQRTASIGVTGELFGNIRYGSSIRYRLSSREFFIGGNRDGKSIFLDMGTTLLLRLFSL